MVGAAGIFLCGACVSMVGAAGIFSVAPVFPWWVQLIFFALWRLCFHGESSWYFFSVAP